LAQGEPAAAEFEQRAVEAQFESSDAIGYLTECRALRTGNLSNVQLT
jgi:hypothetical protein